MWIKIWNWIKNIFCSIYTKEVLTIVDVVDTINNLDVNKSGKLSIKEIIEGLKIKAKERL